jgi:hypothetical protein
MYMYLKRKFGMTARSNVENSKSPLLFLAHPYPPSSNPLFPEKKSVTLSVKIKTTLHPRIENADT